MNEIIEHIEYVSSKAETSKIIEELFQTEGMGNISFTRDDIKSFIEIGAMVGSVIVEDDVKHKDKIVDSILSALSGEYTIKNIILNFKVHPDMSFIALMEIVGKINSQIDDNIEIAIATTANPAFCLDTVNISCLFVYDEG